MLYRSIKWSNCFYFFLHFFIDGEAQFDTLKSGQYVSEINLYFEIYNLYFESLLLEHSDTEI